jgi:hypothetical protein
MVRERDPEIALELLHFGFAVHIFIWALRYAGCAPGFPLQSFRSCFAKRISASILNAG